MSKMPAAGRRARSPLSRAAWATLPLGLVLVVVAATVPPSARAGAGQPPAARVPTTVRARWLTDLGEAQSLSKRTGKPILACFSGSDWCGWCIRLQREVFSTATFQRWAAEHVVLLEVDFPHHGQSAAQTKKNREVQARYGVRGYPTVLFLDRDGKVLGRSGYREGGPAAWTADAEQKLRPKPAPANRS